MKTELGICFPIHFMLSVSLYESSITQLDSQTIFAKILGSFWSSR